MSEGRPRSKYRCNCDPAQHWTRKDGTKAGNCQTDIAHVYGPENPMVRWLAEHAPAALKERAYAALDEPRYIDDDDDDDEDDEEWPE